MAQITLNSTGVASSGTLALQSNGTTTAVTVDASQNVGIGTATPGDKLQVGSGNSSVKIGANGANNFQIYNGALTQDGTNYAFAQNNTGVNTQINAASGGQILFQIASTTKATFDSNGGLKVLNTIGVGAATPSTSGAGITFPATQSASTNANTLDDYEEGTWTPSLGGTATYTNQEGQYTRIGRLVSVTGFLYISVRGTGSTGQITGVPFAQTGNIAPVSVAYYSASATSLSSVMGYLSSATINVTGVNAGGSTSSTDPVNIFQNNTQLYFSCTYYTTT